MDTLPKIIPSWHDITLQDFVRQKRCIRSKIFTLKPTDHGGIGLDVNVNDKVYCKSPKYTKCQIKFAASKCSLPFFPLSKIENFTEPCLADLKKEKLEFDRFCLQLNSMRNQSLRKPFSSDLISLRHQINEYNAGRENQEFNVHVRNTVLELAQSLPKRTSVPPYNVAYAGGTLAVCSSSYTLNFLYPDSENLSQLCITPLLHGNDQQYIPNASEKAVVKLKKGSILQIESALDGFCCVRQANSFHLVNTTSKDVLSKSTHKSELFHIAPSPYNPAEIISVYDKGVMKLRNMDTRETIWSVSDDVYENPCIFYPTWRCSFGSHPFSALSLNEKYLYCFDFREKNVHAREIYSIANPSCYVDEQLAGMKQWNKNPFQHLLTSSQHLILCDERYPKTPVMYWNHCLKDFPLYIECADFDSDVSIIVIGTQGTQELASFLCSHQASEINPVSLTTPLMLSSPTDCINSLRFHCHYINDELSTRLSSPLTGVCVIPNNNEIGFTVLQSTSVGDIFYQDFKQSSTAAEKTYHVSIGCVLTPPEKILPHLSELMSEGDDAEEKTEEVDEALAQIHVNIEKFLDPSKEISSNCVLCRSSITSDDKELILSESCPTCNLTSAESQHISRALVNDSLIIGPISAVSKSLDCDLDYLSTFEDLYSKRMLSVWLESDDVEESQDAYSESEMYFVNM